MESKTKDISGTLQLQNQHKLILETLNKAYSAMDTYLKLKTNRNQQKTKALTQGLLIHDRRRKKQIQSTKEKKIYFYHF